MHLSLPKFLAAFAVCGLCGCQSPENKTARLESAGAVVTGKKSFDLVARNNSLALLGELLNEEKDVSMILIIKSAAPPVKQLVKTISKTTGKGAKLVKSELKKDPGLQLAGNGLPPGEQATRAGLSKIKEHDLLHAQDADFELQLLLTQADALGYGAELALTAANNDPQPDRARKFASLSSQLNLLHEQVVARLQAKK